METIIIGYGEFDNYEVQDSESVSVSFIVSSDKDSPAIFTKSAVFQDGVAMIELTDVETSIPPRDYVYQIRLFDEDGDFFNLRKDRCYGDTCEFGIFKVCPSLQESVS